MVKFYTEEDVTIENVTKLVEEIRNIGRVKTTLNEMHNITSFRNENEALEYFKKKGYVTLEEFEDNIRKQFST